MNPLMIINAVRLGIQGFQLLAPLIKNCPLKKRGPNTSTFAIGPNGMPVIHPNYQTADYKAKT